MIDTFLLSNARGETVGLNNFDLLSYNPSGLGIQFSNTYNQYESYFKMTKTNITQGQFSTSIAFGDVTSESYDTFSQFATFLSYQPLTLVYTTDAGDWMRDARVSALSKSEIGAGVFSTDRLNETFTLDFINPWYNNKRGTYRTYSTDTNLATFGKVYNTSRIVQTTNLVLNSSGEKFTKTLPAIKGGPSYVRNADLFRGPDNIQLTYNGDGTTEWYYAIAEAWTSIANTILKFGVDYTLSFDVRGTVPKVALKVSDVSTSAIAVTSDWKRVGFTFQITANSAHPNYLYIRINAANASGATTTGFTVGQTLALRHIKLEEGKVANPWTPAPEDNLTDPDHPNVYGYWGDRASNHGNQPFADKARADVTTTV